MVVTQIRQRREGGRSPSMRTSGSRVTDCVRCPDYRLCGAGLRLVQFGLRGVCSRAGGYCGTVAQR